jgi:hypothetical protein
MIMLMRVCGCGYGSNIQFYYIKKTYLFCSYCINYYYRQTPGSLTTSGGGSYLFCLVYIVVVLKKENFC